MSRPTIKKVRLRPMIQVDGRLTSFPLPQFVESKYHIEVNATTASQLNRAITSGAEKGTFVLPKGAYACVRW